MVEIKILPTIKEPSEKLVSSTNNSWNPAIRIEQKEEEERNKSGLKWRDSFESLSLHVLIIFFLFAFHILLQPIYPYSDWLP